MTTTFLERGRMGLRGEWRCEEAAVCSGRNTYDNLRGRSLSLLLFPLCSTHFALMGVQEGSEKVLSSFSILNVTQPHLHRYRNTLIMCPAIAACRNIVSFRRSVDNTDA